MDNNQQIKMCSILILSLLLIWPSNSIAASFDCSKATTKVEKMVCANPELSRLDESLSRAYQAAHKRFGNLAFRDQKTWLYLRNVYTDESGLKKLYESRIEELESPGYTPGLGTGAGKDAPAYFSEMPTRSIDEEIEGCFKDQKCASYAEPLIPRYSNKISIDEDGFRKMLKNCLADQWNMNICASFELFILENEFADVLAYAIEPAGERCEIAMEKRQETWENKIFKKCEPEAFEQTGGGSGASLYTYLIITCKAGMYRERIQALRSLGACEPCSKCLNLP